jgi:hypothetical protein
MEKKAEVSKLKKGTRAGAGTDVAELINGEISDFISQFSKEVAPALEKRRQKANLSKKKKKSTRGSES